MREKMKDAALKVDDGRAPWIICQYDQYVDDLTEGTSPSFSSQHQQAHSQGAGPMWHCMVMNSFEMEFHEHR